MGGVDAAARGWANSSAPRSGPRLPGGGARAYRGSAVADQGADGGGDAGRQKRTALYSACSIGGGNAGPSNTAAVAEVLLEYGPEFIDAGDGTGTCPLHLAARQGDVALVQVLLKHSPELDAIDDAGRTALTCATIEGHLEATRVLLEAGASPSIVDASGSDARSWAHVLEHDQILALFD